MIITVLLLYVVMTERWHWPVYVAAPLMATFLLIDTSFFGANALKIQDGGWVTLAVAWLIFTVMTTWRSGRRLVAERLTMRALPLSDFMAGVAGSPPVRVPGTAVFMTAQPTGTPPALAHNVQYNKVLHQHVIVLTVTTAQTPYVAAKERLSFQSLDRGVYNMRIQYGFMEDPDVPDALLQARDQGLELDLDDLTYFLGRETIIPTRREGMSLWRERLFVLMARNAVRPITYFRLPPERVVELGVQVEM
jgi:KUP system potassium uptake protein